MEATAPHNAAASINIVKLIGDSHCHAHLDPRSPELLGACQVHIGQPDSANMSRPDQRAYVERKMP